MPFDDELAAGLTALADRAQPSPGDPEALLRLHTLQQRRRVAVRSSALMAVAAAGTALAQPHFGGSRGGAGLATGSSATPVVTAASDCPTAQEPQPTPLAATPVPAADGPLPTPGPGTPPPMPDQGIPGRIAKALDGTAPTGVSRACDLGTDVLYRAGGQDGPVIDVAASTWTGPLPALDREARVWRRYADGDEYRSFVTSKDVKVELWTAGLLISFTVEPSGTTRGAGVEDLEGWAERVHLVLS